VAALADQLPVVTEGERHGSRTWSVADKGFAWERRFSKADLRRGGDATPPEGPILAVRVGDLGEKEAVLAANPTAFFAIPHFDGYSVVLIQPRARALGGARHWLKVLIRSRLASADQPPDRADDRTSDDKASS
jgi:hypothetical protein